VAGLGWDKIQRPAAADSRVDVLATLHALGPGRVGLRDLGRKQRCLARQFRRWNGQFQQSKQREIPDVDEVRDRLATSLPEQGWAGIVDGDYGIDNCVCRPEGSVAIVLDAHFRP